MMSVVFLELIPESAEYANVWISVVGVIFGAAIVWVLNHIMDRAAKAEDDKSKLHESYSDFFHSSDVIKRKKSMMRSGMIMLFAIGLHNVPEGLALGAAGYHDMSLGITLALIIGLHNIPEGMAVSAPLIAGGLSKLKSVALTFLVGTTTIIGATAGYFIGGISDAALSASFAIASGAMLYVVLGEILPQSIVMSKSRIPTIFTLVGIIVGMVFVLNIQ
jgi:ZIP family zinc transporter